MRQPWICPKCNIAYAPWIDSCACQGVAIPQPIVWDKPITINDPILPPLDVRYSDTAGNLLRPYSSNKTYNAYIGIDGQVYLYS